MNIYLQEYSNSLDNCLQIKREKFHIEIRRQRREHLFKSKRLQVKSNSEQLQLIENVLLEAQKANWDTCYSYIQELKLDSNTETHLYIEKFGQIINILPAGYDQILYSILQAYIKLQSALCITHTLFVLIISSNDIIIVQTFFQLISELAGTDLELLIEDQKYHAQTIVRVISYLVEMYNLGLDQNLLQEWFTVLAELSKYKLNSYQHLKVLLPIFNQHSLDYSQQLIDLTHSFVYSTNNTESACEYILKFDKLLNNVLVQVSQYSLKALQIVQRIVEISDEGVGKLLQLGLLQIFSNSFYFSHINTQLQEKYREGIIYSLANICSIDHPDVIEHVVQSEIFAVVMQLSQVELTLLNLTYIAEMLRSLCVRAYQNSISFVCNQTDCVYLLKLIIIQEVDLDIRDLGLFILSQFLIILEQYEIQQFKMKIRKIQLDKSVEKLSEQINIAWLMDLIAE